MSTNSPLSERDHIYLQILHFGLVSLRDAAMLGNIKYCQVEAEHLHNMPSLIGETNEHRHQYYFYKERNYYLERVDQTTDMIAFTIRRYEELWRRLEELQMRT